MRWEASPQTVIRLILNDIFIEKQLPRSSVACKINCGEIRAVCKRLITAGVAAWGTVREGQAGLRVAHGKAQRWEGPSCGSSFTPGGLCLCQEKSLLPGCRAAVAGTGSVRRWRSGVTLLPSLAVGHIPTPRHTMTPHFPIRSQFFSDKEKAT